MRQILLREPGKFERREVDRPRRGSEEALVRIRRIGVCGSDFKGFAGTHPAYSYPRVLGHEMSCEVVEAPANDRGIRAGDRCAIDPYLSCGKCRACKLDRPNCCEELRILGIQTDGGMQSFLSVSLNLLHKSEKLSFDQLALLEPLSVGAQAVQRSGLQKGERVLVVGAGPIGIAVMQFASAAGGAVRALEIQEQRRALVEKLGIEALARPDDECADVVFDATGSPEAMEDSFNYVAPGGRIVFVGLIKGRISFDDWQFHRREMTVLATRGNLRHFPRIIQMIEKGEIDPRPWITDRLELGEVPQRFQELPGRQTLVKAVIEVGEPE